MAQQKGMKRAAKVAVRRQKLKERKKAATLKKLARAASAHEHAEG